MSETTIMENGFSVTTVLDATPDAVYRAWTEKQDLKGWLAGDADVTAAPGGSYELRWDGGFSARGEFLELVPDTRIVMTWESWGPDGRFKDGDAMVLIDLVARDDGRTEMTQTESGVVYADPVKIEMSMKGTIAAHEALAGHLANARTT